MIVKKQKETQNYEVLFCFGFSNNVRNLYIFFASAKVKTRKLRK